MMHPRKLPFVFRASALAGLLVGLVLFALPAAGERGDDSKRASKNGRTVGTIDGVEVTIEFGRPSVKERAIWGALVPYGEVWRSGANEATTISFSKPVRIGGKELAAGTYALFTIPGEETWTFVFNQDASQWGAFEYQQADDVLRVDVTATSAEHQELLSFEIEGSEVVLRWEELAVGFEVSAG